MAKQVHVSLDEIEEYFESLQDPRSEINQKHPFVSVIVIAVMAVLAGAGGPTAIAAWASDKETFLCRHLALPNGVPKKDVFLRVLSAIRPEAFQACFFAWLELLRARAEEHADVTQPILNVDGKTLRRSHDRKNGLGALHSVSVWAAEFGMTLAQTACEEKSNEITAIPEVLKLVHIQGAIITIDAMGTQTAIAEQIVDSQADYVLALKGNQEGLYNSVTAYVNRQMENDFKGIGARRHVTKETAHGREETRHYIQMPVPADLPGQERWSGLMTIGVAMLTSAREGKETSETRYFISSLPMGVKLFAHAVRSHWAIENSCHWSLDFIYREDESRIRDKHLRENFAWLNRFTLSLLKQHPAKISQVMKRRRCGWNENFLLEVLVGITS
jgi:predicted transposase YbfD/YdcC